MLLQLQLSWARRGNSIIVSVKLPDSSSLSFCVMNRATKVYDVSEVVNTEVTGSRRVPLRWYKPENTGSDALPVIVYFHGGGWVTGLHSPTCAVSSCRANLKSGYQQ